MGTGKSTLARALAEALGAERLSTDAVRQGLYGPAASDAPFGDGTYSAEHRRHVYERMLTAAQEMLDDRRSVVLDGTFPLGYDRLVLLPNSICVQFRLLPLPRALESESPDGR